MGSTGNMQNVGGWDQVLAFGEYQHCTVDGTPKMTVFDASKCRYMLDDFATRKNDLFYDRAHEVVDLTDPDGEPLDLDGLEDWARGKTGRYGMGEGDGKALAWSDALCMVVAGQVVRYAAHSTAPDREPSIEELRRSDGSLPGDGVYSRRSEVTPLGADPRDGLSVYRYTSPYYISMRDGWRLLNLTATNDPRMEGVALAYSRTGRERLAMSRSKRGTQMDPAEQMTAAMKAAGCAEEDAPETKMSKMAAHIRKMEDDSEAMRRKMEDSDKEKESMRRKMEDDEKARGAAESEKEKEDDKDDDKEEKKEKKEKEAMSRDFRALQAKNTVLEQQLTKITALLPSLEQQASKARAGDAETWARSAIAMGRYPGDANGDYKATVDKLSAEYLADAQVAEKMLFVEGKFKPSELQVMERLTDHGAGIGAPNPRDGGMDEDDKMSRAISAELVAAKKEGVDMSKVKDTYSFAMQRINARSSTQQPARHLRAVGGR